MQQVEGAPASSSDNWQGREARNGAGGPPEEAAPIGEESIGPSALNSPRGDGKEASTLEPKGSIYHYIMIVPPIAQMQLGHYLAKDVAVGFCIFLICLMLQLSLTLIAGQHILKENTDMRMMLVQEAEMPDTYMSVMWQWLDTRPSANLTRQLAEARSAMESKVQAGTWGVSRSTGYLLDDSHYDKDTCCGGPECSGFRVQCCKPKPPGAASTAASYAQLAPPAPQDKATLAPFDDAFLPYLNLQLRGRRPGGGGGGGGGAGGAGGGSGGAGGAGKGSKKKLAGDKEATIPALHPACVRSSGIMSCLSPSAAVVLDWGNLDTNNDGEWSLEEAEADVTNMGCRLGTPLVDLFTSAVLGLKQDAWDTTVASDPSRIAVNDNLPPKLAASQAIPLKYFEWWQGLVGMCQYGSGDLCEDMVRRGTFSGLLQADRALMRGGVSDLDSALKYCKRLLQPGGICNDALPGTYAVYRERLKESCGMPMHFQGPRFQNPHKVNDATPLMTVSFTKVEEMQYVHSITFRFFTWLIVVLWYINLLGELLDLVQFWDFLSSFPVVNEWPFLTPTMRTKLRTLSSKFSFKSASSMRAEADKDAEVESEPRSPTLEPEPVVVEEAGGGGPALERYDTVAEEPEESDSPLPQRGAAAAAEEPEEDDRPAPQSGAATAAAAAEEPQADDRPMMHRYSTGLQEPEADDRPRAHRSSVSRHHRGLSERTPLTTTRRSSMRKIGHQMGMKRLATPIVSYASVAGPPHSARSNQSDGEASLCASISVDKVRIKNFARPHYYMCICMAFLRTMILVVLAYAGTYFLLSNHTLLDLLLNALALAFILELDEFTFEFLVPDEAKELLGKCEPLTYSSQIRTLGRLAKMMVNRASWGLLLIPLLAGLVVEAHDRVQVRPMLEALECFCLKSGDTCLATSLYEEATWEKHWSNMAVLEGRR